MTNAELIAKIKAEIERRVDILATVSAKQAKDGDSEMSTYYHGKAVSLEELIPFLSTLESEKPIDQVVEGEVILNGHGLLIDVTKWGDGYKLKVIIKEN